VKGKRMEYEGHHLRYQSDCEGCFFDGKESCPDCDMGIWIEEKPSPWHTGKPTEEGWYLIKIKSDDEIIYDTDKLIQCLWGLDWKYAHQGQGILAWQKINEGEN